MPTNVPSMRFPFNLTGKVHPEAEQAMRYSFNGLLDLNQALAALNTKVENTKSTVTTINETVAGMGGGGGTSGPTPGAVDNQTGQASYILQQVDFGALVILDFAGVVALTLNNSVTTPFYCIVVNFGTATATATPASGTVNGVASWPVPVNGMALFFFDGFNWWVTPIIAQTTPPVANEWLSSYDASTGLFTQTQPAARNLSDSTVGSGPVVLDSGASIINVTLTGITRIIPLGVYANNAAAIAGGLVAGDLYRTSADPALVAVVF